MGETILDLVSTVAAVVLVGVACIALLLYGDLGRELGRRTDRSDVRGSDRHGRSAMRARIATFALTAIFVVFVVVRFTVRG